MIAVLVASQPFFYGVFETRLSTVALCQLLTHCVTTGDQTLCTLSVQEEEIAVEEGVVTRSRRAAGKLLWPVGMVCHLLHTPASPQRTQVPLPVKIMRLLVSDLQSHLEAEADSEGSESSGGEEEGGNVRSMEALLHSEEGQWEESEDDPDLQDDPLLQLDVQVGSKSDEDGHI